MKISVYSYDYQLQKPTRKPFTMDVTPDYSFELFNQAIKVTRREEKIDVWGRKYTTSRLVTYIEKNDMVMYNGRKFSFTDVESMKLFIHNITVAITMGNI